jgi:hypothetical protein
MDYNRTDGKGSRVAVAISKFSRAYQILDSKHFKTDLVPRLKSQYVVEVKAKRDENERTEDNGNSNGMEWGEIVAEVSIGVFIYSNPNNRR